MPGAQTTPLLKLCRLTKTYGVGSAATQVLHGLSFEIQTGEMVAIMGTSGSGKSTLMNIIGTLDRSTTGDYFFAGKKIDDFKATQLADLRNRQIGFVFQSFNLLPRLTVAKNIERPMLYGQVPREERANRIDQVLDQVDLASKRNAYPWQLSGGQQQRVAIARALIMKPALILGDEPTGALDSKTATLVMNQLVKINQETGTTVIIITHDRQVAKFAHRTIHLQDGRIVK